MAPLTSDAASTSLSGLSISTPAKSGKQTSATLDSWEDASSGDDTETEASNDKFVHTRNPSNFNPTAPPPTPASPTSQGSFPEVTMPHPFANHSPREPQRNAHERRPDKTTSVLNRMILNDLGVGASSKKLSDEEKERLKQQRKDGREYDSAMREKLRKEKEGQQRAEEERQKARAAVWDD